MDLYSFMLGCLLVIFIIFIVVIIIGAVKIRKSSKEIAIIKRDMESMAGDHSITEDKIYRVISENMDKVCREMEDKERDLTLTWNSDLDSRIDKLENRLKNNNK